LIFTSHISHHFQAAFKIFFERNEIGIQNESKSISARILAKPLLLRSIWFEGRGKMKITIK